MRNSPSLSVLRLFLRVAETRSFSETARIENVSQPALSRTIRLLEDQLKVRLLDRTTRSVALTAAGSRLVTVAERLIADYDLAFTDLARGFRGETGRVTIGALPSLCATLLPPVIAQFRDQNAGVEVRLQDRASAPLLDLLRDRRIDFALTIEPEASEGLLFEPLLEDSCLLVCRPGDPFDRPGPLRWSALADAPFIAMASETSVRQMTDIAFARAGVNMAPNYECAQLATMGGLIAAGLGVSALPATVVPLLGVPGLAVRPLHRPDISRSLGLVRLPGRSLDAAANALISGLRAACATSRLAPAGDSVEAATPDLAGAVSEA